MWEDGTGFQPLARLRVRDPGVAPPGALPQAGIGRAFGPLSAPLARGIPRPSNGSSARNLMSSALTVNKARGFHRAIINPFL